jgi:organic hydroperoxide reductase OsmC/OhrA
MEDKTVPQAQLQALAMEAHEQICPYSHATRDNVPFELTVQGAWAP